MKPFPREVAGAESSAASRPALTVIDRSSDTGSALALADRFGTATVAGPPLLIVGDPPCVESLPASVLRRCHRLRAAAPGPVIDWLSDAIGSESLPAISAPGDFLQPGDKVSLAVRTLSDVAWCKNAVTSIARLSPVASSGFGELLLNAVEHGNLEITFEQKTALLDSGGWHDEIRRRLDCPAYRDRYAVVSVVRRRDVLELRISDEGTGFDWRPYTEAGISSVSGRHGRGIILAQASGFLSLRYLGRGSDVILEIAPPA